MENNEFKKVRIKNRYYFDETVKLEDIDFVNILIEKKSYENMLIYNISYKALMGPKPLLIRFNKIDGFIRICYGTRYLVLLGPEKYNIIYNLIRYLISLKSGITYIFSDYFAKIKVDSSDSLHIEKILTFHNVIIHIKSVLNKDKNHYYYNIFLEKCP